MSKIQEAWDALNYVGPQIEERVLLKAAMLVVHVDMCGKWTGGGTLKRAKDCGDDWYCDEAEEIRKL